MECVTNFQFATTCTMSIVGPCVNTTLMSVANNVVDYKLFNEKIGLFAPTVKVAAYMTPFAEDGPMSCRRTTALTT